jgi:small subunit ribosomal protein S2
MEHELSGLQSLTEIPAALLMVDSKEEETAVREARKMKVPIVAILNSDCDPSLVDYPVPGNDSAVSSVRYFLDEFAAAYKRGKKSKKGV